MSLCVCVEDEHSAGKDSHVDPPPLIGGHPTAPTDAKSDVSNRLGLEKGLEDLRAIRDFA